MAIGRLQSNQCHRRDTFRLQLAPTQRPQRLLYQSSSLRLPHPEREYCQLGQWRHQHQLCHCWRQHRTSEHHRHPQKAPKPIEYNIEGCRIYPPTKHPAKTPLRAPIRPSSRKLVPAPCDHYLNTSGETARGFTMWGLRRRRLLSIVTR
jgi:hypothetical protein